jgi:hypothetical protein
MTLTRIEDIPLKAEQARMGLYEIKIDENNGIKRIDVFASVDKVMYHKGRIALIKKKWQPCDLTENRELLLGYFYTPSTLYRRAHLSPL